MGFERFTKSGRGFKPRVSIWSRGQIGFNRGAVERFELAKFKFVVLFYDKADGKIGFLFTNDSKEEGVNKLNVRNSGAVTTGKAFLDYYNIPHEKTIQYDIVKDEESGMCVIHLAQKDG